MKISTNSIFGSEVSLGRSVGLNKVIMKQMHIVSQLQNHSSTAYFIWQRRLTTSHQHEVTDIGKVILR